VKCKDDAKRLWHEFNSKYSNLAEGISAQRKILYAQGEISAEFRDFIVKNEEKVTKAAIAIQNWWRRLRQKDTLVKVNPAGNHTGSFNHLVNYNEKTNHNVKKSLNKAKLDSLDQAIKSGNWDDPIFNDPTLPQLALTLYDSEKITQQQIYTLLERHQTLKDFPLRNTYKILDENEQFTQEAREFLLPIIRNRFHLRDLADESIEEFRLMVAALPGSEQVFYTTGIGKLAEEGIVEESIKHSLGLRLLGLDAMFFGKNQLIHLTSGARDALGLVRFGLDEYVRPMPRLGVQKLGDIEHGVKHQARYAAVDYPETKPYKNIHDYLNVKDLEATSHDVYHGNVMSTIPKNFLFVLWRFIDISRAKTGYMWSKEIWDWVDTDYLYFFHQQKDFEADWLNQQMTQLKFSTELFFDLLNYGNGTSRREVSEDGSVLREDKPTPMGVFIFIDMVQNRNDWLQLKIDPNYLAEPFKQYYLAAKEIYEYIKNDEPKIQLLKYNIYVQLKEQKVPKALQSFQSLNTIINARQSTVLAFNKVKKEDEIAKSNQDWVNTVYFTYDGKSVTKKTIANMVLGMVSEHYMKNHIGVTADSEAVGHYWNSIITLGYATDEAEHYVKLREQGMPDEEAQFIARPNLENWIKYNFLVTTLCCMTVVGTIVLLYGAYQVYQQAKLNQQAEQPQIWDKVDNSAETEQQWQTLRSGCRDTESIPAPPRQSTELTA